MTDADELAILREQLARAESRAARLDADRAELIGENADLRVQLRAARRENARLAGEIDEVSRRIARGDWVRAGGKGGAGDSIVAEPDGHVVPGLSRGTKAELMERFRIHHEDRAYLDRGLPPPLRVVKGEEIRLLDDGE